MSDYCCPILLDPVVGPRCGRPLPCPDVEHDPQLRWRKNPVYYKNGELLTSSPVELLENLRRELGSIRGKLFDVSQGFGWSDRINVAENGITLVISYLYDVIQEMEKVQKVNK